MTFPIRRRMILLGSATFLTARPLGAETYREAVLSELADDPDQPVLGNPEGDVTLVEFFDYQCPFCRKSHAETRAFVEKDGRLRWMMKDWPMFGPVSDRATMLALGAVTLGRYAQVNAALMALEGRKLTVEQVDGAARKGGVDPAVALESFQGDYEKWTALVGRNMGQAAELGLMGTPSYAVGSALFQGATPVASLARAVAQIRKK